jgi:hypothetical protein
VAAGWDDAIKANCCIINYQRKAMMHKTIIHRASEKRFKNEPDSINKSVSAALCCRVPL